MHEAGLPNYKMTVWHALYAPKGTPKPIIDKLSKALQEALKDANLKQRYAELGAEAVTDRDPTPIVHTLDTGDAAALVAEIKQRYETPLKTIFEQESTPC